MCRVMQPVSSSVESRVTPSALVACLIKVKCYRLAAHQVQKVWSVPIRRIGVVEKASQPKKPELDVKDAKLFLREV